MILKLQEGRELRAHFSHTRQRQTVSTRLKMRVVDIARETSCRLHFGSCSAVQGNGPCQLGVVGVAHCSSRDQFCKATGRKVAFTRAIRRLLPTGVGRGMRAEAWKDFLMQEGILKGEGK